MILQTWVLLPPLQVVLQAFVGDITDPGGDITDLVGDITTLAGGITDLRG